MTQIQLSQETAEDLRKALKMSYHQMTKVTCSKRHGDDTVLALNKVITGLEAVIGPEKPVVPSVADMNELLRQLRLYGGITAAKAADIIDALNAQLTEVKRALAIAGPIALADFTRHPFILNDEEKRKIEIIKTALAGLIPKGNT